MSPALLPAAIFALLLLVALLFAALPLLRARGGRPSTRFAGLGASTLAILIIGGGFYLFLGRPSLAVRSFGPPRDVPSLIAALAERARGKSFDATGWALLGRGYLSLGDAPDAAAAFRRAAEMAAPPARPGLLAAYGEALTMAAGGTVTAEAEQAFHAALTGNPHDFGARYYLGLAAARRGDTAGAARMWRALLADAPPDAPWKGQVIDRLAALQAASGTGPDIQAMVAGLAARLKSHPDDPEGWQRLVRAYEVLGNTRQARDALASAREALKTHPGAMAALDAEARELKLSRE